MLALVLSVTSVAVYGGDDGTEAAAIIARDFTAAVLFSRGLSEVGKRFYRRQS